MRLAFVVRLGQDTSPSEGLYEGWVEEVDTCTELRFRTKEELFKFLGKCFERTNASTDETTASEAGSQQPSRKKRSG
jgi:hypothetical protein